MFTKEEYLKLKRALFDKCYASLNSKQREAVYTVNNPLLILAGAGSGKTTVLVKRIVFIMKYGNAYLTDYVPEFVDDKYPKCNNSLSNTVTPFDFVEILK